MWNFFKKLRKTDSKAPAWRHPFRGIESHADSAETVTPAVKEALSQPLPEKKSEEAAAAVQSPEGLSRRTSGGEAVPGAVVQSPSGVAAPKPEKPIAEKTDDELAEELNNISPEILSQAKNPQMRKLIIDIYRKMLLEGVNVKDEKEVKKWLKKHPEAANGGEVQKIETVKRSGPKIGRNDHCPCGSGKKYKKCCGRNN